MILAAGLGTRMRPLSALRPKPALPVRGVPLVGALLALLARHGFREVMLNLHHEARAMRETALRCAPPGVALYFSEEPQPLGTGGGIRRAADFLRAGGPVCVMAGDMLLDVDLGALVERHRARGDAATLLLRSDARCARFGSLGIDEEAAVRRIGSGEVLDLGGERAHGLFTGVRVLAPWLLESLPDREGPFEDLRDWLAPRIAAGARDVRGELLGPDDLVWEPVGTPAEYLAANLAPPALSTDADTAPLARGTRIEGDVVIGAGAQVPPDARLARVVVWDAEQLPAGFEAHDGVFAGGRFHPVAGAEPAAARGAARRRQTGTGAAGREERPS